MSVPPVMQLLLPQRSTVRLLAIRRKFMVLQKKKRKLFTAGLSATLLSERHAKVMACHTVSFGF
jgi:hypothetical protein